MTGSSNISESALQAMCFQWHWNTYPNQRGLLHANNNNSENAIKGSLNKAIGVVQGVADMEYNINGHTVFIEMKTVNGTQSKAQKAFQSVVVSHGFPYHIVRSFEEFKTLINHYQNVL